MPKSGKKVKRVYRKIRAIAIVFCKPFYDGLLISTAGRTPVNGLHRYKPAPVLVPQFVTEEHGVFDTKTIFSP